MLLDSGFSVTLCVNIVVCRQAAAAAAYTERLMESADMSAPRGRSRSRSQPGTSTSRTSTADGYNMADLEGRLAAQRGRTLSPHARQVPDFHKLHETWHRRLATAKATNKRRVTVPQVCGGGGGKGGSGARLQLAYVTFCSGVLAGICRALLCMAATCMQQLSTAECGPQR